MGSEGSDGPAVRPECGSRASHATCSGGGDLLHQARVDERTDVAGHRGLRHSQIVVETTPGDSGSRADLVEAPGRTGDGCGEVRSRGEAGCGHGLQDNSVHGEKTDRSVYRSTANEMLAALADRMVYSSVMTDSQNITLHWFLPTSGDSREIVGGGHGAGPETGERVPDLDYLTQVARAAEYNGFESVLTPTGRWCQDAWVTTAALLASTSRLKFLVALRPGLIGPTLTAHQALTYQELSDNRLLLNVVVGGEDAEQKAFGDYTTKAERYEIADETLEIADHLWHSTEPLTFHGKHLDVEGAALRGRPAVSPPIFLGGSSDEGIEVAAKRADVYLTWGEPPEQAAEKISLVRDRASSFDRTLEYGVRLHVIARPTVDEAWAEAQRLLDSLDPERVRAAQEGLATSQSEGQRRMTELHGAGTGFSSGQDARRFEIAPNLWAGIGLVRGGAGTALVGSYEEVAERIDDYRQAGIAHVILSGVPHLEETFRVGEGVVPALRARGVTVTNVGA